MSQNKTYVALLRGINVGGRHKVPMAELRHEMENMGFEDVTTLLNSGNVIFTTDQAPESAIGDKISNRLEAKSGFPIPVVVVKHDEIKALVTDQPFKNIEIINDIRLYVSFLKKSPEINLDLPWVSEDKSFRITDTNGRAICSVLDLSVTQTPRGMESLEKLFGKDITTRNWNTIIKIAGKLP